MWGGPDSFVWVMRAPPGADKVRVWDRWQTAVDMTELHNLLANSGGCLFLAASVAPSVDDQLRHSIDATVLSDQVATAMSGMLSELMVASVVCFGPGSEAVAAWVSERKAQWKRSFSLYRVTEGAREILECFPFLHASARDKGSVIPHRINDYLYLGDYSSAHNPLLVTSLGVCGVVNASTFENAFPTQLSYLCVNVFDSPSSDIQSHFEGAIAFIDGHRQKGGKVLVHCAAGISRSTSIVLAYLMKREGLSLRDAYLHVKGIRNIVSPNSGFIRQLLEFERQVHGRNSVVLPAIYSQNSYFGLSDLLRREMEAQGIPLDEEMQRLLSD